MTVSPVSPWKLLTTMPPPTDTIRPCFSRLSALHQPTILMWGVPLGCPPKSSVSLSRLLREPFTLCSNFQILDSPASLEGDAIMWSSCSQGEVCWRIPGKILLPSVRSTWLEAVFLMCGWALGVGGLCRGATATPVTKRTSGRSAHSLKSWAAGPAGTIQTSCWVRPVSPSEPPNAYTMPNLWSLAGKRDPAASFLKLSWSFKTFLKNFYEILLTLTKVQRPM